MSILLPVCLALFFPPPKAKMRYEALNVQTLTLPDLHKIYVDDESYNSGHGHAYRFYGVDPRSGVMVVVRPDQCECSGSLVHMRDIEHGPTQTDNLGQISQRCLRSTISTAFESSLTMSCFLPDERGRNHATSSSAGVDDPTSLGLVPL